jgi:hypothetical protein
MPVKSEKAFVHVRVRNSMAIGLRKIARLNFRRGIQTDANLAIAEYIHKHAILTNRRDDGN